MGVLPWLLTTVAIHVCGLHAANAAHSPAFNAIMAKLHGLESTMESVYADNKLSQSTSSDKAVQSLADEHDLQAGEGKALGGRDPASARLEDRLERIETKLNMVPSAAHFQDLLSAKVKVDVEAISEEQLLISNNVQLQNAVEKDFASIIGPVAECPCNKIGQDCPVSNTANKCMAGLAFKVKGKKSLLDPKEGKVARDIDEIENMKGETQASQDLLASPIPFCFSDLLRYTLIVQPQDYVETATAIRKELKSKGYELSKMKNYWQEGNSYLGINDVYAKLLPMSSLETTYKMPQPAITWLKMLLGDTSTGPPTGKILGKYFPFCKDITDPTGQSLLFRIEFQFHTPDSFNTKMGYIDPSTYPTIKKKGEPGWTKMNEGHHLYEVMRATGEQRTQAKYDACKLMNKAAEGLWKMSVTPTGSMEYGFPCPKAGAVNCLSDTNTRRNALDCNKHNPAMG